MGKWYITDGDKPGTGQRIGFVRSLPTGHIQIQIDGFVTPAGGRAALIQITAAINDAQGK
jgi:hypothetical protein